MKLGAAGIRGVLRGVDVVLTSPLVRAAETASIAAKALGYKHKIVPCKELLPEAEPGALLQFLTKFKQGAKVLLVGHQPGIGLVASALIGSGKPVIEFKKGTLCRIDVVELPLKEPGRLIWLLAPKQLRTLTQNVK